MTQVLTENRAVCATCTDKTQRIYAIIDELQFGGVAMLSGRLKGRMADGWNNGYGSR